jgi:hypothetical protein
MNHREGEAVAEFLMQTCDIQPFLLSNGSLGVHFMILGASVEVGETLTEYITDHIGGWRHEDGRLDHDALPDLATWRATLLHAMKYIDDAMLEITPKSPL